MRERQPWMVVTMLLVWTALYLVALRSARGQTAFRPDEHTIHAGESPVAANASAVSSPVKDTVGQQIHNDDDRNPLSRQNSGATSGDKKVIVIGFVGGFVKHDDAKHAEVQFAALLRDRNASGVTAEVFGNHERQQALVTSMVSTSYTYLRIDVFEHELKAHATGKQEGTASGSSSDLIMDLAT